MDIPDNHVQSILNIRKTATNHNRVSSATNIDKNVSASGLQLLKNLTIHLEIT
jgi:hypothetical protein